MKLKKIIFKILLLSIIIILLFNNKNIDYKKNKKTVYTNINKIKKKKIYKNKNNLSLLLILPFIILLLMIATGPIFYQNFWHKYYIKISMIISISICIYYIIYLNSLFKILITLIEYIQFILLILVLYISSGGIFIEINKKINSKINLLILFFGSCISNLIGTTGASIILIRPYIKINKKNIKPYHIIFFIFIISNIGGSLTPIGDPPLFLGFLKGVPFFWTLKNNFLPWIFSLIILGGFFYIIDFKNHIDIKNKIKKDKKPYILIYGGKNFFWLIIITISIFLENKIFHFIPDIKYNNHSISFIREIIIILIILFLYKNANKYAFKKNKFNFKPLEEICFVFIAIFISILPILEIINNLAQSNKFINIINYNTLYWSTGLLSGFLDNAPTYLNLLNAIMSTYDANIHNIENVKFYTKGIYSINNILELKAISIASVFFGALTYIGNGPNFIVKSIAEKYGIKMPSFFEYIIYFSIPLLMPVLIIIWLLFFYIN